MYKTNARELGTFQITSRNNWPGDKNLETCMKDKSVNFSRCPTKGSYEKILNVRQKRWILPSKVKNKTPGTLQNAKDTSIVNYNTTIPSASDISNINVMSEKHQIHPIIVV